MHIGYPEKLFKCKFAFTGTMDRKRDEMMELCEQYGGVAQKSLNKSTDYLVCGENTGESEVTKAKKFVINIISEGDFLKMIT